MLHIIRDFEQSTSQILLNLHQMFQHAIQRSSSVVQKHMLEEQLKYRHRPEVCNNWKHNLQG